MKKVLKYIAVCFSLFFVFVLSTACGNDLAGIRLKCELTELGKSYYSVVVGKSFAVEVETAPADFNITDKLTWSSSNTGVATVDNNGNVKTVAAGKTVITAKYKQNENITASITLKVSAQSAEFLSFTREIYSCVYGEPITIDVNQEYNDIIFEFSGTLANGTIYPVEQKNVQPKEAGIYTIKTTYEDYYAEAALIIEKRVLSIPVGNYKKVYGANAITKENGVITEDFASVDNEYENTLPNGDVDVIYYSLACDAVDIANPDNTTYTPVGTYPITLNVDETKTTNFSNNYTIATSGSSSTGTLTVEPLAVTLVAKNKTDIYGSNNSFLTSSNYSLYRTAEYEITPDDRLSEIPDLASSSYNGVFTNQISFSTTIYKDGSPYTGKRNIGTYDLVCSTTQILGQNVNGKTVKNLTIRTSDIIDATYTVTPRPLTVTPVINQSKFAGEFDPEFRYTTNSGGIVEGDVLVPFLTRVDANKNTPGKYNYDIITFGDPYNFVINDNYNITLNAEGNQFEIKQNSVYFILKSQVLNYGQETTEFDYEVLLNGTEIDNLNVSEDGWITLQNYTYDGEKTYSNQIKPTITIDSTPDADPDGYYKRYQILLDYTFNSTNEGYKEEKSDEFFSVEYNSVSPAYVCFNKIDLIVKPFTEDESELVKIYDNKNSTDIAITGALCEGFIEGEDDYSDVFTSINFKKTDNSTLIGKYPLTLLQDYSFKDGKDFYNVIQSDEIVYYEIVEREIKISVNENQTKVYGSENKDISYNVENLATGDLLKDVIYAISISRAIGEDVGSYSYKLDSITLNPNYTYTFNNYLTDEVTENKFTITKRNLTITAVSQSVIYGENINALTYVVSIDNPDGETFLAQYKPLIIGSPETTAKKHSVVGDYPITKGTVDAGSNFNITFVDGKVSVLKRSATFTVLANEVSSGITPNTENIKYTFEGLIEGTIPEIEFNILPDNEETPTKYALSGEVYGKNNATSALTFNYLDTYNTLSLLFNGENVFECYDISIKSTVAFYVSSLVLNLSVVNKDNKTSSIVTTTYDGGIKDSLFVLVCDDNNYIISTGYNFIYRKPGVDTDLPEAPTNAGTYTVSVDTASIEITNAAGDVVTPTLNISSYGSLTINKANLYYKTNEDKPGIRPMEFGSTVLPTELVGKKISDTPLDYEAVKIYTDAACTLQAPFGVKATYNTEVYSENYIRSLTVQGSPYAVSMMIVPSNEEDQANYNPVAINFDLVITPRIMTLGGASFTYSQGVRAATYSNKVINNPLTLTIDEDYADKIGVSYSYVGVNYNSTNPEAYGMLAYYEEEIYVGDASNIKYIQRTDLSGANFTHDPVKNYILASKGSNNYYLQLTHLSGVPINAGIYFVVANVRSTNGNYALPSDSQLQFETLFEVTRSEEFEISNWVEEFMFGISETEIMNEFSFTTNPSRVKAYCSIVYELGDDILYLDGTNILAICPADQLYKVKVIISSPNYFQEIDKEFRIIQLDAVISFPAADKYHFTGSEVFSFILNTKVTLYNFDGSIDIVVHDKFSEIGPYGEAPMQVKYFFAYDEDDDGTPETIGEELETGPIQVGYYYIECIYNDRTYYGTNSAFFEITKTYYAGAISLENAAFAYDPFLTLERSDVTGKSGLYQWIYDNMIKIPVDELESVHYKKTLSATGNPKKQIHLSIVDQEWNELVIGENGIKNCGTYTIRLVLSFNDQITQTTTSEATLTINKVALNTEAFETGNGLSFVYSGHEKYNEVKYLGATNEAMTVPVVGYKQFTVGNEDIEGWYGYFNGDTSNFCIVYNYTKANGDPVSEVNTNGAPIVPGSYKCRYTIIPGDNYLRQTTIIPEATFSIKPTTFNSTDSHSITVVYDGSDQSINENLKLIITNNDSAEIKITCVYENEGKYYDYNGGEIYIDEAYDETKGIIFEKYFYRYTVWDQIETGRVLDTENKLTKEFIRDAGHYQVYYKLIYPTSENFSNFFSFSTEIYNIYTNPAHRDNALDSLVTIKEAPFMVISNDLISPELGVYFYSGSSATPIEYNKTLMGESVLDGNGDLVDVSLSSTADPLLTITQGIIKIYINGSQKDNLTLKVYDASDSSLVNFTKDAENSIYTSASVVPVGNYYFVLSHKKDDIVNFYDSVWCYFRVVQAKVSLTIKTNNMQQDATTGNYKLNSTDLYFNFSQDPNSVIMEYNKTHAFEESNILNKWLTAGGVANPVFTIEYYQEKECLNKKTGSITTFDVGTYFARINIDSTEYSVERPLVVKIIINETLDYIITVTKASFNYQNYTDTSFAVSANYSTNTILGTPIFFSDDGMLEPEYIDLMNQFILDNPDQGYELRTRESVRNSVAGAYNTVGFFKPLSDNYAPKAFGYKYTVTSKTITINDIASIAINRDFVAGVVYNTTSKTWVFNQVGILKYPNYYPAKVVLLDGTILNDINISFTTEIIISQSNLDDYFDEQPLNFGFTSAQLTFESGDYSFSEYLSNISNVDPAKNKLLINIVKPSLTTVLRQVNSINKVYNGAGAILDLKSLAYSSIALDDGSLPLQTFDGIVEKIYGGNIEGLTVTSDNMTITGGTNYEYTISTIDVGDYTFTINFPASECFAETSYTVSYKISKISAAAISRVRYEYEPGKFIENVGNIIIDPFGNMPGSNGAGMFYLYDEATTSYICLHESLDNTKFQVEINGNWYSLTDKYLATINYYVGDVSMGSIDTNAEPKDTLRALDYINNIYVKIKFVFDANSVVDGETIKEFVVATLYTISN